MKKVIFGIIVIGLIVLGYFGYKKYIQTNIDLNNIEVLINTEYKISDFVKKIDNGELINKDETVLFDSLGNKEITIKYKNRFKKEINYTHKIEVIDNEEPIITFKDTITITAGDKLDLLKDVKVEDNSKEEITPEVIGEYDANKAGTYELKYKATDSSGNTKEEAFKLVVKEKKVASSNKNSGKYYVKINKTLNVVMVYEKDSNNEYTKLVKTFVTSAGDDTPLGTFTTTDRYETLSLYGGVWGHYTVRIYKGIWFHSVPYFTKPTKDNPHWDNLEYEEYNKLGTLASAGCIRLSTIDAKWIYDNLGWKTTVEIYESDTLPEGVVKPTPIKIDVNSENKGWDPTDPDPDNPWKN